MQNKCSKSLYLGIDPPLRGFHYPVIYTERVDTALLKEAIEKQDHFTHWIFTSKTAVRYWYEVGSIPKDRTAIAIGEGAAAEVQKWAIKPLLAKRPTQEGVISLLNTLDLQEAFICYPRSNLARGILACHLQAKKIPILIVDLYTTLYQKLEPVPDLREFEEIIFTSPSTVEGFRRIFGAPLEGQRLKAIGPITLKAIKLAFARSPSLCYSASFRVKEPKS